MKTMKNIKPAYATKLGKGVFVGYDDDEFATVWVCEYCGKRVRSNGHPGNEDYGVCPRNYIGGGDFGYHHWKEYEG